MKNKKIILGIGVVLIIIIVLIIVLTSSKNYKNKTITENNYETILEEAKNANLTDEERTQLMAGLLKYTFNQSGIYGKKVKDIIEEGKSSDLSDLKSDLNDNTVKGKLNNISKDFVTEIWNDVFCNISWYVKYGTSSTGENLDIEYTLNKADNLMSKRDEYNDYINALEGEEYSQIKYIWEKLIGEIDRMYARIKEETPRKEDKTYEYSTGNFSEYSDDFKKEIDKLD